MNVLGISAWYHDAAACLVRDGRILAACEEERFSRRKHDARYPRHAVEFVLRQGGIAAKDLEREVSVEIGVADATVRTGERSWSLAQDARRLAELEVTLAEDRFSTGAASNIEVVEAQARLVQAVVAEVDALAAYNLALLDAWRARGRLRELAG